MDKKHIDLYPSDIRFLNLKGFVNKSIKIKDRYVLMTDEMKYFYKLYIYSNSFMKVNQKDLIWEFLNEPFGSCYYITEGMLKEYISQGDCDDKRRTDKDKH